MRKILGSNYFLIAIYLFLALLAFGKLIFAFFQQDEWAIIGTYLYFDKANLSWFERLFTYGQSTHTIPLTGLLSYFEYKLFGLSFFPFAYISIAIHTVNTYLVYYLAYLFFKKKLPAFIAGLIFLVDFIPSQAVTWIATTTATAGATLFVLLSIIFLTKFLMYESEKKLVVLSFICLFLSLLFKESSIFMFLFLPIYWFFFDHKRNYKRALRFLGGISLVGGLYIFPRLFLMFFNSASPSVSDGLANPSLSVYLYRIVTFPFKAIPQSIIPTDIIIPLADKLVFFGYPDFVHYGFPDPIFSQSVGSDIVSYAFALIILLICTLFYKKAIVKNLHNEANIIVISILFIALSALPLIFIPGASGYFSFFDGRSLYLGNIFKSILLADIFFLIYLSGKKKVIPFLALFVVFFVAFNVLSIRKDLDKEIEQGVMRQSILTQIQKVYPKLPKKIVFYTQSDTAYYGLPVKEKIMPFLSGFGQTLLVWYEEHGVNFPSCFFQNKYLYAIVEEGYKECEGRGFGYFRKIDNLKKALKDNNLSLNNVFGIRFSSSTNLISLIDMHKEFKRLTSDE